MIRWDETVFCAMDTETTGIDPEKGDRIIEIAMVPIFRGRIIIEKSYTTLINPGVRIPALTEKVHRISNQQIESAPTMREVFPTIRDYMKGMIAVFHNGKFDLMFLDFAAKEIGEFPLEPHFIDTQDLAAEVFGRPRSLEWLAKRFSLTDKINHRALDDAIVTARVFLKLASILGYENVWKFVKKWSGAHV